MHILQYKDMISDACEKMARGFMFPYVSHFPWPRKVGLTIDEVFANSLSEVGSADVVADRIASIEKQKDGNFTTEVMFAKDIPAGDVQTYLIEYRCDTSRGDIVWEKMQTYMKGICWE